MPKLNRKKSKRITCSKKFKIIKKVAEHRRKLRREAKKKSNKRKPKDPGVPNSLPFKDEILHEAELRKQRAIERREAQKENRRKLKLENRGLQELVNESHIKEEESKGKQFQENCNELIFKSPLKHLKNVIEFADIVLEVLDIRDPLGCRCPQIEEMVIAAGKKLILVLNKADLVPRSSLYAWLSYLRKELPTVAFRATSQVSNLNSQSKTGTNTNEILPHSYERSSVNLLIRYFQNYCKNAQTSIKIGFVGFPNVGKKSIISSLKKYRQNSTGINDDDINSAHEVSLDKYITMLDYPGEIIPKNDSATNLVIKNFVKAELLTDIIELAEAIVANIDHTRLRLHYTFPEFSTALEFLELLSKRMGKYKKKGIPNIEVAAKRLINDWNLGHIRHYTNPPEEYKKSAYINVNLSEISKLFDVSDSMERRELDNIMPDIFPSKSILVESSEPTEGLLSDEEDTESN